MSLTSITQSVVTLFMVLKVTIIGEQNRKLKEL